MTQLLETAQDQKNKSLIREGQKSSTLQMEKLPVKGYEQVVKITDKKTGLQAIVAIHDLTLGPALGGIRVYPYASFNDALEDVLRLSRGMTYKAAIAEVGFGGGKSVVIADPKKDKTPEMLRALGEAIESLQGNYICAEDSGFTLDDARIVRQSTRYIVGMPHEKSSGDPAPFTAWGTFRGIQSVAQKLYGSDSLEGRTVAVQGLGSVGAHLVDFLFWAGAELIISDIDMAKAEKLGAKYRAKVVAPDQILKAECDILAPCAMGAVINDQTLSQFKCRAIAGCANNQLLRDGHALALRDLGILYAPDFVINAGGLLNVAAELDEKGYHPSKPRYQAHHIYDTLLAIYEIAEKNHESTHAAALALAEYRIKYAIGKRELSPVFHHTAD